MSLQINSFLIEKTKEYLGKKFSNIEAVASCLYDSLEKRSIYFNKAIDHYNIERRNDFEQDFPWIWCVNAQETAIIMCTKLPPLEEVFTQLLNERELANQVFKHLRDNTYFNEVWELKNLVLADNIVLLIYRTAILFLNEGRLFDTERIEPRVQLSSTIEEMIFCQKIIGEETLLFDSFKHWLKKWNEEGFTEELYSALKANL